MTNDSTQTQLAVALGVRRGAVSQWEQAAGTAPSVSNLSQIAIVTKVRFDWLATGRGATQLGSKQQAPALVTSEFARDGLEIRLLVAIRHMRSGRKRPVLVKMLAVLTS